MSKPIQFLLRFYPDRDDDLIEWLQSVPGQQKTDAIKALMSIGLTASKQERNGSVPCTDLNAGALQQLEKTIQTLPEMDELLPAIRQIVQNVVSSELARIKVASNDSGPEPKPEENSSIEDALSAMEDELIDDNL
jgi:hypothetical protein